MADLSKYGTVTTTKPDLSQYGTVSGTVSDTVDSARSSAPGNPASGNLNPNIAPSRSRQQRSLHTLGQRESDRPSTAAELANLMEGTAKYGSGAAVASAVLNPVSTATALLGGEAANVIGNYGSQMFGASPDTGRLIGDIASIPGAKFGDLSGPKIGAALSRAGKGVAGAFQAATSPEFLESIPGGKTVHKAMDAYGSAYRKAMAPVPVPLLLTMPCLPPPPPS